MSCAILEGVRPAAVAEVVEVTRRCRLLETEASRSPCAGPSFRLDPGFYNVVRAPGVAGAVQSPGDPAVPGGPCSRREDAEAALRGLLESSGVRCGVDTAVPADERADDRGQLLPARTIRT